MNFIRRTVLPVFLATLWIGFSEFIRNEVLFKSIWVSHYDRLGLVFPSEPVNGAIWGVWSLFFAVFIYVISRKFAFLPAAGIAWFAGFVLMWTVIGNLGVLPGRLLVFAVPLSLLESFVAVSIVRAVSPDPEERR